MHFRSISIATLPVLFGLVFNSSCSANDPVSSATASSLQSDAPLKIGHFNIRRLGQKDSRFRDMDLTAQIINQWDVVSVVEVMPLSLADQKRRKDLLAQIESIKSQGLTQVEFYKGIRTPEGGTQNIVAGQVSLQDLIDHVPQTGVDRLESALKKIDPSWKYVISKELDSKGFVEQTAIFYRSSRAKLQPIKYCQNKREHSGSESHPLDQDTHCTLDIPPKEKELVARPAFMAGFKSGNFDFILAGMHLRFGAFKMSEQELAQMMKVLYGEKYPLHRVLDSIYRIELYEALTRLLEDVSRKEETLARVQEQSTGDSESQEKIKWAEGNLQTAVKALLAQERQSLALLPLLNEVRSESSIFEVAARRIRNFERLWKSEKYEELGIDLDSIPEELKEPPYLDSSFRKRISQRGRELTSTLLSELRAPARQGTLLEMIRIYKKFRFYELIENKEVGQKIHAALEGETSLSALEILLETPINDRRQFFTFGEINVGIKGRVASLKIQLPLLWEQLRTPQEKDLIIAGDFNLEMGISVDDPSVSDRLPLSDKVVLRLTEEVIRQSSGAKAYVTERTAFSDNSPSLTSAYDHFILDPNHTGSSNSGECFEESARSYDFTNQDVLSQTAWSPLSGQTEAPFASLWGRFFPEQLSSLREKIEDQLIQSFRISRNKVKLHYKEEKVKRVLRNFDKNVIRAMEEYREGQPNLAPFYELISDHLPIEITCQTHAPDDDPS